MQVTVPFAEKLADLLPTDRVEVRRAFPLLISTMRASALLHQQHRQIDEHGRLLATVDDYQITRHLLLKPLSVSLGGGLSEPAQRFFTRLLKWVTARFTTSEVKRRETASPRAVHGWLNECLQFGLLEILEPARGPKPAVWDIVADAPDPSDCSALPTVEEVST
jgi:hypothetical protein